MATKAGCEALVWDVHHVLQRGGSLYMQQNVHMATEVVLGIGVGGARHASQGSGRGSSEA
eukprot:1159928-Pelagomonas_calceolata.AAC.3